MKVKIISLMVLLSFLLSSVPYSLLITSEGEQVAPPDQVILPGEKITIDKKVYDPSKGEYVEYAKFEMGTESIQFRCICAGPRVSEIEQLMGDFSIVIIDKLPANLIYGGYSNYEAKYDESENTITWELSAEDLRSAVNLDLYFNAKPVALGIGVNEIIVEVQSAKGVYTFNDTATVEVVSGGGGEAGLGYADKKVLDREGNWVEETRVMVGDRVTFRCSVYLADMPVSLSHPDDSGYKIVYYPPFSRGAEGYLMDKLPSNLRYVEESANIPPSFYDEANNTLYWYLEDIHRYIINNFKIDLQNHAEILPGMDAIYFDAEAVAPGKGVNVFSGEINASCDVMVDGGRPDRKGETFTFEDTATVWVIEGNEPPTCRLVACPISGYAPLKVFFHIDAEDSDGYIINWSLDVDSDGTPEFSGQDLPSDDLVYTYNEPGLYIAKLIVEDDDGAVGTDTAEIQVLQETEENQPPSCRLRVEPSSGYPPLNVTFWIEATDPDGEIVEWSLDVDDDGTPERSGSGSPPSTVEYTYESPGIYTARLTVVDDDGASADDTVTINVYVLPGENQPPTCSIGASPTEGYAPLTVVFSLSASDPDGEIVEWSLDVDDDGTPERSGSGSPPSTIEYTYDAPGTYTARLTVIDDGGASANDTVEIEVWSQVPGNEPPTCSLDACPIKGEAPLTVIFLLSASDPDGNISSWSLDVDDDGTPERSGSGSPPSTVEYTYESPGIYTARLTVVDDDGASADDTVTINVYVLPGENQPPTCSIGASPTEGYAPLTVVFSLSASDPDGEIVEWSLDVDDDGTPERSGSGSPPSTIEYTYDAPGTYTARLIVVDDGGAIKDTTFVVNVFEVSPALTFINITRPVECTLYFMDREIIPLIFFTVAIGPLTIDVNASDDVTRVEFFVDNESKYIDDTPPFSWKWNETPLLGFYTIKVVGYGEEVVTDEIDIIAINLEILERLPRRGEGVKVYGKVCDSSKILFSGIRGARVTAYYLNESGEPAEIADKDTTGFFLFRRGRYSLNLEANKTYLIKVEARGYESAEKIISTYTENRSIRLDFYLNKTILVKGKVTTKSFIFKRPIRGANVTIIKDGEIIANLTTNIFGRFKVWLTPGNYTFIVSAPGYEELSENITLRPTLTGKKILRFELSREASE